MTEADRIVSSARAAMQLDGYAAAIEEKRDRKQQLASTMLEMIRLLMPAGTIISADRRSRPQWARSIRVVRGRDHGSHSFEIARINSVDVDDSHVDLSRWQAHAYPLSEKTGKRMRGLAGPDGDYAWISSRIINVSDELCGKAYADAVRAEFLDLHRQAAEIEAAAELNRAIESGE